MKEVVITSAVRTAAGRFNGTLKDVPPERLGAVVIKEAIARSRLDPAEVDEVILGCVLQSNEAPNVARIAALWADVPVEVPAYTIHRQCGSGLQAINSAAMQIMSGNADIVVAGGTESMTMAPYYLTSARSGYRMGHAQVYDPFVRNSEMASAPGKFPQTNMGLTAEALAEKYNISREEQDRFALASQQKAGAAIAAGVFAAEIVPVPVPQRKGDPLTFATDEHCRPDTTLESLAKLPPAFKAGGTVTAGNSSGLNDAAAAAVVMSAEMAQRLGLEPLARIAGFAVAGVDPTIMGIGPAPAIRKVLERTGLRLDDIDLIELNEAFAAQSLAVLKELGLDDDPRVNVNGGAIALGHPVGATGAKLTATLLHEMARRNSRCGIVSLCIGGGMGIATVFAR